MVVILAQHSPRLLLREITHTTQPHHPSASTGFSSIPFQIVSVHQKGSWVWRRRRRGVDVGAFWQDSSKPMSMEMEPIKSVEELDGILRKSQEDDNRSIVINWVAAWCRKCIYLKPRLEKLAADFPKIKFYSVDVNNVSQALVKRGNISKMPTIQLWKEGEMRAEVIGGHKAWLVVEEVREMVQNNS